MANQKMEAEEQEALFHSSYPCAVYYVQSPSTVSHANSSECRNPESAILSPFTNDNLIINTSNSRSRDASRFTLSRYSSSRGSNNSFLHEKKIAYDLRSQDSGAKSGGDRQRLVVGVEEEEEEDVGGGGGGGKKSGLWRFLSLDPSSSCFCVAFQIIWRLVVSLGVALLVFFLATRPPTPKVSVKIVGIKSFALVEGLDNTGVVTKILSCNCSMNMDIDNKSKVFGLHIHPPTMELAFGRLKFASLQGQESYVESDSTSTLRLYVNAKSRPVYGAGRTMQDLLESGRGLPLAVRVRSRSSYHMVWNLIRLRYRHQAECLLILDGTYDEQNHTLVYNSTCSTTTSHA